MLYCANSMNKPICIILFQFDAADIAKVNPIYWRKINKSKDYVILQTA